MDASDVVDLVRVATCSRVLHDLFSDGAVKASMEHSREASNRADISEAHFREVSGMLSGMLHEVTTQRDAALDGLRESRVFLWAREQELEEKDGQIRVLEEDPGPAQSRSQVWGRGSQEGSSHPRA